MILQEDFDKAFEEITSSVQREDIEKLLEWKGQNEWWKYLANIDFFY